MKEKQLIETIKGLASYMLNSGVMMDNTNLHDHEDREQLESNTETLKYVYKKAKALRGLILSTKNNENYQDSALLYIEYEMQKLRDLLASVMLNYDDLDLLQELL